MDNSVTTAENQAVPELTGFGKVKNAVGKCNSAINFVLVWLYRLRKVVLALPVAYYALKIAEYNSQHLPEQVGIHLQATGEFAMTIGRGSAVMYPLALTAGCLALMFCSRKAMYSWAISVFTLALPILLLVSNVYPA